MKQKSNPVSKIAQESQNIIINSCRKSKLSEPEYKYDGAGLWTIFYYNDFLGSEEKVPSKIIGLIQKNPSITAKELAETLCMSDRMIRKYLAELKSQGKLIRVGPDKGGSWEVQ